MKKVILTSVLTAAIVLSGTVQAKMLDKHTEAKLINICEAIQSNSKIKVHIAIKNSGIPERAIHKGLVCNGYDPVTFAVVSHAEDTAKYLAGKSKVDYSATLAKL